MFLFLFYENFEGVFLFFWKVNGDKPYEDKETNRLQNLASVQLILALVIGLFLKLREENSPLETMVIETILLGSTFAVVMISTYLVLYSVREALKKRLEKRREKEEEKAKEEREKQKKKEVEETEEEEEDTNSGGETNNVKIVPINTTKKTKDDDDGKLKPENGKKEEKVKLEKDFSLDVETTSPPPPPPPLPPKGVSNKKNDVKTALLRVAMGINETPETKKLKAQLENEITTLNKDTIGPFSKEITSLKNSKQKITLSVVLDKATKAIKSYEESLLQAFSKACDNENGANMEVSHKDIEAARKSGYTFSFKGKRKIKACVEFMKRFKGTKEKASGFEYLGR